MEELSGIPPYSKWREILPIDKGWSGDRKYKILDEEGRAYLLRTSPSEQSQRKEEEFRLLVECAKTGIEMSMPVDRGIFDRGRRFYSLFTWVEGIEAEEYLGAVPKTEQYGLGLAAGEALRKLHAVPAPRGLETWESRFNRKIDAKISNYRACPVKAPSDGKFLDFISENRSRLRGREQTFQHGDYHVGNLIVTPRRSIGVIDFNRFDFGDPWEEFNRIIFCSGVSPSFASGRIDGYFGCAAPEDFFLSLALYLAVNAISSIPWAILYGEKEVATMLGQAESILEFYDGFSTIIPKWYAKP